MWLSKHNGRRRWRERLSAYIDGRLPPGEGSALETHLASCEACRKELAELQSVVALLHSVPQMAVPRSFALPQAPAPRPWWLRYEVPLRFAAAASAVLLVAVVAGDLLFSGPTLRGGLERKGDVGPRGAKGDTGPGMEDRRSPVDTAGGAAFTTLTTPTAVFQDSAAFSAPAATPAPSPAEVQKSSAPAMAGSQAPSGEPPQEVLAALVPTEGEEATAGGLRPWLWAEGALAALFGLLLGLALLQWRASRRLRW